MSAIPKYKISDWGWALYELVLAEVILFDLNGG